MKNVNIIIGLTVYTAIARYHLTDVHDITEAVIYTQAISDLCRV